jgi:hypothetical protein
MIHSLQEAFRPTQAIAFRIFSAEEFDTHLAGIPTDSVVVNSVLSTICAICRESIRIRAHTSRCPLP